MKISTNSNTRSLSCKLEVSSAYDAQVYTYEKKRFSGIGGKLFDQLEKRHALRWLKRCNVLQVGTATGRFMEFLPKHGYVFCGVEISQGMAYASKLRGPREESEVIRG